MLALAVCLLSFPSSPQNSDPTLDAVVRCSLVTVLQALDAMDSICHSAMEVSVRHGPDNLRQDGTFESAKMTDGDILGGQETEVRLPSHPKVRTRATGHANPRGQYVCLT